jgi:hypothetical protein
VGLSGCPWVFRGLLGVHVGGGGRLGTEATAQRTDDTGLTTGDL